MSGTVHPARPGVIFDLDGTLVDTSADIAAAANAARQALGLVPLPVAVTTGYVGDGVQRLMERVLAHDPATGRVGRAAPPELVRAGLAHFAAHYGAHLLDNTAPYSGIAALLSALRGRPLFLATNKPRRFTLAILAGLGLADHFRRVVAGDDVPVRKPDPGHLAACLVGSDLAAAQVVMVGDSANDVLAARGLGCRVVGVTWGLGSVASLVAAGPDALVASVPDLARELGATL